MFTFIRNRWLALDPGWRFALGVFLIARILLSLWAYVVAAIIPLAVSNLDLHGEPVVTAFDLHTSARAVFSRVLDGQELHFRAAYPNLVDVETNSVWDLTGRAVSGERAGAQLSASAYLVEDVFPYRGVTPSQNIFLAPWQRFDANWYLKIAERGYSTEDGSSAFFPFYPALIHVTGTVVLGNSLLASLLVSNLAVLGALLLVYKITRDLFGENGSKRAGIYYVIFPTAFFLFAPYTESLFLFLSLAAFYAGQRGKWLWSSAFGMLAALTRLQGALLVNPLTYLWWRNGIKEANKFVFSGLRLVSLFLIPLAGLSFLAVTKFSLVANLQGQWQAQFVAPWQPWISLLTWLQSGQASPVDVLNLMAALFFGAMLVPIWRNLPREYFMYALPMYIWPFFRLTPTQPLVSMTRYVIPIFPVFMLWGDWGQNAWAQRAVVYLSIPFELFLSAQFILWGWVG